MCVYIQREISVYMMKAAVVAAAIELASVPVTTTTVQKRVK